MLNEGFQHLRQEEIWWYGPMLVTTGRIRDRPLADLSAQEAQRIPAILGIRGPWATFQHVGHVDHITPDWRSHDCCYGVWDLGSFGLLGVLMEPNDKDGGDFSFRILGEELERVLSVYPWNFNKDWVTPEVIRLHRVLIERVRALHKTIELAVVLIRNDFGPGFLERDSQGILISQELGDTVKLRGKRTGHLFQIPLGA